MRYTSITTMSKNRLSMTIILTLLILAGLGLIGPQRAEASHPTIPASAAPGWVRDVIHDKCINSGWNIVQLQWIAPQGSPAATSVTVPFGSASVPLTLNRITYRCKTSSHSYGSSQVVSTSPSIPELNGLVSDMPYPGSPNSYSSAPLRDFNYPGPFTTNTTITLTLTSRGTTTYSNGLHYCAVVNTEPRRPTPHQHNFTPEPGYCVQSSSSFTIQVNVGPPPTHWDYVHQSFSTAPASSATAPYPRYRPGTSINVSNTIRNNGDGSGRAYTHQIQRRVGSGAWTNIQQWSEGGLASGGSRTRSTNYNLPTSGAPNDVVVCFRGQISPYAGQSTPTSTVTSSGWRITGIRCVRVYNPPPTTGGSDSGCSFYRVTVNDATDGFTMQLFVDGASAGAGYSASFGPGSHTHQFDLSAWDGFAPHQFFVRVTDNGPLGSSVDSAVRSVGPCFDPSLVVCGSLSTSVGNAPEQSEPFTVQMRVDYTIGSRGTPPSRPEYIMTVSMPGVPYNNPDAAYTANTSTASFTTPSFSLAAGRYTATWTFRGPQVNITCTDTFIVVTRPYVRIYNGDVSAGFSTCPGWTTGPSAGAIIGYNNGSGGGSGVQLAAFALGQINEFSTATGRTSDPRPPKGLSFANTAASGSYGGQFGAGFCPPDYFGERPAVAAALGSTIDVSSLASGTYQASGDVTISGTIADGTAIVIYIDGDAYIPSAGITNDGAWANLADIPSFYLIVRGDIYIDRAADAIDGNYIAQPNGAGGDIYTCAFAFRAPTENELINDCRQKLSVRGSLTAKRIRLTRTNGSLRSSSNTEQRTSATIAEALVFGPEIWLGGPLPDGEGIEYEAITSLPPVL